MFNRLRKKPMTEEDTPVNKPSTARLNLFFFAAFVIFSILIFR